MISKAVVVIITALAITPAIATLTAAKQTRPAPWAERTVTVGPAITGFVQHDSYIEVRLAKRPDDRAATQLVVRGVGANGAPVGQIILPVKHRQTLVTGNLPAAVRNASSIEVRIG